jgi:hypothetical protein
VNGQSRGAPEALGLAPCALGLTNVGSIPRGRAPIVDKTSGGRGVLVKEVAKSAVIVGYQICVRRNLREKACRFRSEVVDVDSFKIAANDLPL